VKVRVDVLDVLARVRPALGRLRLLEQPIGPSTGLGVNVRDHVLAGTAREIDDDDQVLILVLPHVLFSVRHQVS
jgi:hypothetical protein